MSEEISNPKNNNRKGQDVEKMEVDKFEEIPQRLKKWLNLDF